MSLSAPTKLFFLISLVFFVLGVLDQFGVFSIHSLISAYDYLIAWVVLAAGCIFKGI
ncbi:MAG: hypothetical protein P1V20_03180 [Verrucomicrobiales bacterium]|nr:hypothetical protein [Verrucomicrobiales bacterium]